MPAPISHSGLDSNNGTSAKQLVPHLNETLAPLVSVPYPSWLLLGIKDVPLAWQALVDAYVRVVLLELSHQRCVMKRVVLRARTSNDRLQLTLRTRPRLDPGHEQRLMDIARVISNVCRAIPPTSQRPWNFYSHISQQVKETKAAELSVQENVGEALNESLNPTEVAGIRNPLLTLEDATASDWPVAPS